VNQTATWSPDGSGRKTSTQFRQVLRTLERQPPGILERCLDYAQSPNRRPQLTDAISSSPAGCGRGKCLPLASAILRFAVIRSRRVTRFWPSPKWPRACACRRARCLVGSHPRRLPASGSGASSASRLTPWMYWYGLENIHENTIEYACRD